MARATRPWCSSSPAPSSIPKTRSRWACSSTP
jgi:hypothetical protein